MRLREGVNVKIDQSPCLQEGMESYYCTSISTDVSSAGCCCQVLRWVLSIERDHKVPCFYIGLGCFGRKFVAEVLRTRFLFYFVYLVHVEPLGAGRDNVWLFGADRITGDSRGKELLVC